MRTGRIAFAAPIAATPLKAPGDAPQLSIVVLKLKLQALTSAGLLESVAVAIAICLTIALVGQAHQQAVRWVLFALLLVAGAASWCVRIIVTHALAGRSRVTLNRCLVLHRFAILGVGLTYGAMVVVSTAQGGTWSLLIHAAALFVVAIGANAASGDKISLGLWIVTAGVVPAAVPFTFGTQTGLIAGISSLLACLAVLTIAGRLHLFLMRAWRVWQDNDELVSEMREQVSLVERANQEKSRFLAAASHDLRQPMHALGLFAAALEKSLRDSEHHPMVTNMARAVDALEQSFSVMLDISKLDAGVVTTNPQTFPIRDVFRRLHMHCGGEAEERGLSLRFKAGGKLVTSDPQLLERVLSNLVQNALRYTHRGGVTVLARTRREGISLEVWDTGIGIPANELANVFNEFYQVGNTGRDRNRGLGMGLAIVKRLVALLGHSMEVKSSEGQGTVVRILLQSTPLDDMGTVVLAADTLPSPLETDRTVLVIDDEESVRIGMRDLLQSWGFDVLLASTIDEAVHSVRQHAGVIDVLVSDLRLGGGEDGIEAIRCVRDVYGAPLPALLVTGDTSPAEVKRAHDSGHPVLFKPVRTRDLYAALRRVP